MQRLISLVCLSWLLTGYAQGALDPAWEPVETPDAPDQVSTWVRQVEAGPVKAFRGEVVLPYSWLEVLTILDREELYPQWVFRNKSARRVEEGLYLSFHGIWPVADRDVFTTTRVTVTKGRVTVHTNNDPGTDTRFDGHVRIPTLENTFDVVPKGADQTRVVFTTYVDPGGRVPAWLSNMIAIEGPLATLRGLGSMLQQHAPDQPSLEQLSAMYRPVLPQLRQLP